MSKKNLKRIIACLLSFVFFTTLLQTPIFATAIEKEIREVFVKIRYSREDKNYEGWNLWVWNKDKNGNDSNSRMVEFLGEDEEGKFAVVKSNTSEGQLGVILRRSESGNEWAENYFGEDKFVDLSEGDKELIINNKEEDKDLEIKGINKDFDKVTMNINYFRFNGDYEPWDIWSWLDGVESGVAKEYPLSEDTEYGKKAIIEYTNVKDADERGIGLIVRKPDWSAKDIEYDRFVNLAYANNNGEINIYLVQGNEDIFFREKDAIKDNKIIMATIDSINEINFTTNSKMPSTHNKENIRVKENGENVQFNVEIEKNLNRGKIIIDKNIDLGKAYSLEIDNFGTIEITLGKIFSTEEFKEKFHYDGELGSIYSNEKTVFKIWSPTATSIKLALYNSGDYINDKTSTKNLEMVKGEKGLWELSVEGDLKGIYYDFLVRNGDKENNVTDPYAKAVGVNGRRAMVIDMSSTNPKDWQNDKKPALKDSTDAVIYEMHIKDFTIDESSNVDMEVRGKYNGVWQNGKTLPSNGNIKTGIDHLKELGITHLHILPTFDHRSIDETNMGKPQYNWGYDPQNYNVPEGSYSSDPYKAEIRIKEFKNMIMELHKAGIRVVMDVVYNHTGATVDSHLNLAVSDYYYRQNNDGGFSNGSGCGNEIASERSMVRKMIVDSIIYWAKEYGIDGFRFDLMGLHDIDTMREIRTELDKIDKSIILYGEGWTGGDTPLPEEDRALKKNIDKFGEMQISAFSDDMRDGVKGHVFDSEKAGFINGFEGLEEVIKFGIVASTKNDNIKYGSAPAPYDGYGVKSWANQPYQTINYASAHDNLTLWDKLQTTNKDASKEELEKMNKMSAALILTSQGIPFFQGGEEFARTKVNPDGSFNENSYNASDEVNKLDWNRKEEYDELFNYYKGLIKLRKSHKAFRMNTANEIQQSLTFLEKGKNFDASNVIAYTIDGTKSNDKWDDIAVIFNSNKDSVEVTLPTENWEVVVDGNVAGVDKVQSISGNKVTVPAQSSYVLVQKNSFNNEDLGGDIENKPSDGNQDVKPETKPENKPGDKLPQTGDNSVGIYVVIVLIIMLSIIIVNKKRIIDFFKK